MSICLGMSYDYQIWSKEPLTRVHRSEPSFVPLIFKLKQNENLGVGLWWDLLKLVNFVVWYPGDRLSKDFFYKLKASFFQLFKQQ